jgi:hypothetical protein
LAPKEAPCSSRIDPCGCVGVNAPRVLKTCRLGHLEGREEFEEVISKRGVANGFAKKVFHCGHISFKPLNRTQQSIDQLAVDLHGSSPFA